MSTVKYRSSKEVISALKKAMKNQEQEDFEPEKYLIGSDGDQDLAMDMGGQMSARELSRG